jgi:hypothetical protein
VGGTFNANRTLVLGPSADVQRQLVVRVPNIKAEKTSDSRQSSRSQTDGISQ